MRRFLPLILVLAALLLDISVVPILVSHWAVPSLSLCTVCVLGLLLGRTRGSLYGLIGGVLMDVLVGYPLGLKAVLYILSGYLCGVAGRKFQRYLLTVPVAARPVLHPVRVYHDRVPVHGGQAVFRGRHAQDPGQDRHRDAFVPVFLPVVQ